MVEPVVDPRSGEVADHDDKPAWDAAEATHTFVEWVTRFFARVEFAENGLPAPWCKTWWVHPEAVERLTVLWKAYMGAVEADDMRSPSSWWIDHWDRHRLVLSDRKGGPFRYCSPDGHLEGEHSNTRVYDVDTPPAEWLLPENIVR